ncbi:MAG: hypothetical protein WDA00_07125 [Eubacteriales bacterium]
MIEAIGIEGKYLSYKNRPLVRQENELYYGSLSEPFYAFLMIMSNKEVSGISVPDKVMIQLLKSEDGKIENQSMASSLSEALEISEAWLERYNRK